LKNGYQEKSEPDLRLRLLGAVNQTIVVPVKWVIHQSLRWNRYNLKNNNF